MRNLGKMKKNKKKGRKGRKGSVSTRMGKGLNVKTLHTPYGDAQYIEKKGNRFGKRPGIKDFESEMNKTGFFSNMSGCGGGDYLGLGNKLATPRARKFRKKPQTSRQKANNKMKKRAPENIVQEEAGESDGHPVEMVEDRKSNSDVVEGDMVKFKNNNASGSESDEPKNNQFDEKSVNLGSELDFNPMSAL